MTKQTRLLKKRRLESHCLERSLLSADICQEARSLQCLLQRKLPSRRSRGLRSLKLSCRLTRMHSLLQSSEPRLRRKMHLMFHLLRTHQMSQSQDSSIQMTSSLTHLKMKASMSFFCLSTKTSLQTSLMLQSEALYCRS